MRYYILAVAAILLFAGCSEDKEKSGNKDVIKVEKEVKKSSGSNEALICLDEGKKITCKLMTKRINRERKVEFEWESPNGKDDRKREILLPANHASTFDSRLKKGRVKGLWTVEVEIDDMKSSTTFKI